MSVPPLIPWTENIHLHGFKETSFMEDGLELAVAPRMFNRDHGQPCGSIVIFKSSAAAQWFIWNFDGEPLSVYHTNVCHRVGEDFDDNAEGSYEYFPNMFEDKI